SRHPSFFHSPLPTPPTSPRFPYTTLFRSFTITSSGNITVFFSTLPLSPLSPANTLNEASVPITRATKKNFMKRFMKFFFVALVRSEEHTSELQSRENLVCRLLLEKKKKKQ